MDLFLDTWSNANHEFSSRSLIHTLNTCYFFKFPLSIISIKKKRANSDRKIREIFCVEIDSPEDRWIALYSWHRSIRFKDRSYVELKYQLALLLEYSLIHLDDHTLTSLACINVASYIVVYPKTLHRKVIIMLRSRDLLHSPTLNFMSMLCIIHHRPS